MLAGAVEVRISDELVTLQAGDTLILPSLAPHAIRVTGGPDTRTAYITSDYKTCTKKTAKRRT